MGVRGRRPEILPSVHADGPDPSDSGGTLEPIEAPEELSREGREVWDALLPDLQGSGVFKPGDVVLLVELVEAIALSKQFRRELQVQMTIGGPDSQEAKRLRSGWIQSTKLAWSMASEFGISPVARVRLGLARVQGASLLDAISQNYDS